MRGLKLIMLLVVLGGIVSPIAHAERFYFYKEAGKQLERDTRIDGYDFPAIREQLSDVYLALDFPKRRSNEKDELDLSLSFAVRSDATYYFFVEELAVRNEQQIYFLHQRDDLTKFSPLALKNMGEERVKRKFQNESLDGHVKSKYEVAVKSKPSLMQTFVFKASPLPKRISLDYKFRIRKEGGPTEFFEGTIPLERTSYNVGWWEKFRS